jgi:hypothetical protein
MRFQLAPINHPINPSLHPWGDDTPIPVVVYYW